MNAFTPNKTVVPMIVSIVLIIFPGCIRFCGIVACAAGAAAQGNACRQDRCSHIEVEHNIALEVNGVGSVGARGESNRSPSLGARRFDGLVDCRGIDRGAVAVRAIGFHIEYGICARPRHGCSLRLSTECSTRHSHRGSSQAGTRQL